MFPHRDTTPSRHVRVIPWSLIAANVVAFLYVLALPAEAQQQLMVLFGIVPARFTHPDWATSVGFPAESLWPFVTSQFLHGGVLHILFNMWTLWIFAVNVEHRIGALRFLSFYLLCR